MRVYRHDVPKTSHFHLPQPNPLIDPPRPILHQHLAILMVRHATDTIPDQVARDAQPEHQPDQRDYPYPLLFRVFLVQPRPLLLALLDAAAVEVALAEGGLLSCLWLPLLLGLGREVAGGGGGGGGVHDRGDTRSEGILGWGGAGDGGLDFGV